MLRPALVDGISTVVIGYGPGKTGPLAIVIWTAPDGSPCLRGVPLSDVKPVGLPKKLRHHLTKLNRHLNQEREKNV